MGSNPTALRLNGDRMNKCEVCGKRTSVVNFDIEVGLPVTATEDTLHPSFRQCGEFHYRCSDHPYTVMISTSKHLVEWARLHGYDLPTSMFGSRKAEVLGAV